MNSIAMLNDEDFNYLSAGVWATFEEVRNKLVDLAESRNDCQSGDLEEELAEIESAILHEEKRYANLQEKLLQIEEEARRRASK